MEKRFLVLLRLFQSRPSEAPSQHPNILTVDTDWLGKLGRERVARKLINEIVWLLCREFDSWTHGLHTNSARMLSSVIRRCGVLYVLLDGWVMNVVISLVCSFISGAMCK